MFCKYMMDVYNVQRIIIASPDTDVAVISCYQFVDSLLLLRELWLKTGLGTKRRNIAIHDTSTPIGSILSGLLPVFHAIPVSAFSGIGKKSAFTYLKDNVEDFSGMEAFGESANIDINSNYIEGAIRFICAFYDKQFKSANINELLHKLFTKKNFSGEKLPPTLDALLMHLHRAAYQCFIWKSASDQILSLPQPVGNGWIESDGLLSPEYMVLNSVPESVLELV